MDFTDRRLKCIVCHLEFIFSAAEQEFFHQKGFKHDPKYCKRCKAIKFNRPYRKMTSAKCAQCGKDTIVPFQPTGEKPVLCRTCFQKEPRNREPDLSQSKPLVEKKRV